MRLGAELRRLRQLAGFTQAQLAERVGISQPYLGRLELDKHQTIGLDVAFRFADAFAVDVNTFRPFFTTPTSPPAPASPPPLASARGKFK